jgi:hypothetical protein
MDNVWYWAPPVLVYGGTVAYVKQLRKDYLFAHRH